MIIPIFYTGPKLKRIREVKENTWEWEEMCRGMPKSQDKTTRKAQHEKKKKKKWTMQCCAKGKK
jgi:hypothetical protein